MGKDINDLVNHANDRIKVVFEKCNSKKLYLNPKKSEFMVVTNREVPPEVQLRIGGEQIKRVDLVKYLDVFVDRRLNLMFI